MNDASGTSRLLTLREAAALLSVSERTVWQLGADGQIPQVRIGRAVRYDPADLRRWIEKQKRNSVESAIA